MSVSALSAARTICELRDWNVSNLALQKILYIAQMIHLGQHHEPLIVEHFEAWEYGPVVPEVYHRAKGFGNEPVRNVFHWIADVDEGKLEHASLAEAVRITKDLSPSRLVGITHWQKGAWYRSYRDGARGTVIPNELIAEEYRARTEAT